MTKKVYLTAMFLLAVLITSSFNSAFLNHRVIAQLYDFGIPNNLSEVLCLEDDNLESPDQKVNGFSASNDDNAKTDSDDKVKSQSEKPSGKTGNVILLHLLMHLKRSHYLLT